MKKKLFKLLLIKSYLIGSNTLHLIFKCNGISFLSGQFVTLHILDKLGKKYFRNYSIANSPNKKNILEISISRVKKGLGTGILFNLKKGDLLHASGPLGKFLINHNENIKRYILVATGTGIAIYRSMLNIISHLIIRYNISIVLVMGCRKKEDAIYYHDFLKFKTRYINFRYAICYSRNGKINNNFEKKGHIQYYLQSLNLDYRKDVVFLCGNPFMIDSAISILKNIKFSNKSIKKEKYIISI